MSSAVNRTRQDRSSTLPTTPADPGDKRYQQARQHGHRPNASHHFHVRHQPREGTQHLGADIANFLNPRSIGASADPSRGGSRTASGDNFFAEGQPSRTAEGSGDGTPEALVQQPVSWDQVRELQNFRQETERTVRNDLEILSGLALSKSRQVDSDFLKLQASIRNANAELGLLKELAFSTSETLSKYTKETIPSTKAEHERQISRLQANFEKIEKERIRGLENRLERASSRAQELKDRMQEVREHIKVIEAKDAEELKRSRRRHRIFWTVVVAIFALIALLLLPRADTDVFQRTASVISHLNETDFASLNPQPKSIHDASTKSPAKPLVEENPRLQIFDEL